MSKLAKMKMKKTTLLGVSVLALSLAGCSVVPEVLTSDEHQARVEGDLQKLYADQEAIEQPISMYDAMARALKYNMDNRLKMMEEALSKRQLDSSNMGLLPELTMNAGYTERSEPDASNSSNVETNVESTSYSYSEDQQLRTADLGVTWNVLDFGLSYIRAHQTADRYLISTERRRKVVHNVIQDVREAYWSALSAQRLLVKIGPLQDRITNALARSKEISDARLRPRLETLQYRRDLLEGLRQLKILRRELTASKVKLATLMNIKPGTAFKLKDDGQAFAIPEVKVGLKELENIALLNRPELREEAYQKRIRAHDVTRAMMNMIPGISFDYSVNYDSNSYNYSNNWADWGVSVSYNLLKVFTDGGAQLDEAEAQIDVVNTRRLALSMAVLTQLHTSWANFKQYKEEFRTTTDLYDVNKGILTETSNAAKSGSQAELDLIEAELNTLLAELRRDVNYADMLNAAGKVFVSVGADPLPDTIKDHSLETLSQAIEDRLSGWYAGKINMTSDKALEVTQQPKLNDVSGGAKVTEKVEQPVVEKAEKMVEQEEKPVELAGKPEQMPASIGGWFDWFKSN
ncbi:TolC family protein [Terasakiella sp. A23]|uniref:TolC family protein n=1 Tax=Terasakiella sp. FCG-A23 TaxID=3080561 RepID=UPI002954A3EC|nr:TolC family protein [Terasakiella sp. A23]MDV7340345.1 TolC family protein [Terasakiella sp. A23]